LGNSKIKIEKFYKFLSTSQKMDRLTTISATLFLAADVFAIVSLAMPDWIVTDTGETRFGLMWSCVTLGRI
jgi:hypothetical protein